MASEEMIRRKPFTAIAAIVFAVVAGLHLLRLIWGWEVSIGGLHIPMWASIVALFIAAGLAVMLWHEARPVE